MVSTMAGRRLPCPRASCQRGWRDRMRRASSARMPISTRTVPASTKLDAKPRPAMGPFSMLQKFRQGCGNTNGQTPRQLIESTFLRGLARNESISPRGAAKGERGIWQRRYGEHTIRDEADFARHVNYVHINPVKHGLIDRVRDWAPSSFHRPIKLGNTRPIGPAISRITAAISENGDREAMGFARAQPILRALVRNVVRFAQPPALNSGT